MYRAVWCVLAAVCWRTCVAVEYNRTVEGYPNGMLSNCVGSDKPAFIPTSLLSQLLFIVETRTSTGGLYRKRYNYFTAGRYLPADTHIDFRARPTVVFVSGFTDGTGGVFHRVLGNAYSQLDYNIILIDTCRFTTYIYTVASRITRDVGRRAAEVLAQMTQHGLDPKRTELVGLSLGAHVVSYIAKNYRNLTGQTFGKLVGLDPAGPCFRSLPPNDRLDASDADNVLVVHTNIDAYGIATPVGHVDFYVNGGEFQPSDIPVLPCLILCSHLRSFFLYVVSLQHPNSFVGMRCDTVQEARDAACYNKIPRITNTIGPKTNFSRPGVYYLSTNNEYPYYLGKKGLRKEYEVWSSRGGMANKGDVVW